MKTMQSLLAVAAVALVAGACDDRQQRVEETAAPGMEQDAAAPASGPVDIDVDTIQPGQATPAGELEPQRLPPVTPPDGQQPPGGQQQPAGQRPPGG
jgi:hypothetical protein